MNTRIKSWIGRAGVVGIVLFAVGCGKADPQSALEAAAVKLEEGIAQKQASQVTKMLHENFSTANGMDRKMAQQQMLGLFMRYQKIKVLVVNRSCQLDKNFYDRGHCMAQVGVTGAQGLIPERAELYRVKTTWQQEGKDWLLLEMEWD